jgi:hypothetical protein
LSIIAIPSLISNYLGGGLTTIGAGSSKIYFMQFSLGNQLYNSSTISASYYNTMIKTYKYLVTISDALYSLIFFIFYLHWDYDSNRINEELKK